MSRKEVAYVGWIGAQKSDREVLEKMGVRVDRWNAEVGAFDRCEVPASAYPRFVATWRGRYVFGLRRTVVEVPIPGETDDEDIPF